MLETIEDRLEALGNTFVTVFVDCDPYLVEYYMNLWLQKYKQKDCEVVRVNPTELYQHAASMGFFQKDKILCVMQLEEKDYETLSLNCSGVKVLVHAPTGTVLKKIQKFAPDASLINNATLKPWQRKDLLSQELVGFAKGLGVEISSACAHYFTTRIGQNFSDLCQELKKVLLYCKDGPVTRESIDLLVQKKSEDNFFVLAQKIIFRKEIDAVLIENVQQVHSLFVALRYQIYIALNLVNGTSDTASKRVKGKQLEEFNNLLQKKGSLDLVRELSYYFSVFCKVREHKIKPNAVLTHILAFV